MNRFGNGVNRTRDDFPPADSRRPFGHGEIAQHTERFLADGGRIDVLPVHVDRCEAADGKQGTVTRRYAQTIKASIAHNKSARQARAFGGGIVLPGSEVGPKPSPRAAALAAGLKQYTGKPCPKGHTSRFTSNFACVQCSAAYRRVSR